MTIKEIINGLEFTKAMFLFDPSTGEEKTKEQLNNLDRTTVDACEGAIDLLKQYKDVPDINVGELISRQAAIDAIKNHESESYITINNLIDKDVARVLLEELPSVNPDLQEWQKIFLANYRSHGKWIPHQSKYGHEGEMVYTCDRCGYNVGFHKENFCPNCGSYNGGNIDG